MHGIMRTDVDQLGTANRLLKGEKVVLEQATNVPQGGYYATPVCRNQDSILIVADDVCINGTQGFHEDFEDEAQAWETREGN